MSMMLCDICLSVSFTCYTAAVLIAIRLQAELVSERERLLDLSRREASHAATMSNGLSDKSKHLETTLVEMESKLFNCEKHSREIESESKTRITELEGDLVKAQTTLDLRTLAVDHEKGTVSTLTKEVKELEKSLSGLSSDLEHEKNHSKELLQKSNW